VSGFAFELPDDVANAIAERAAALVLERLTPTAASEYLNVDDAAELLRCERQRIYDLCSSGRLRRYKDGARVLVSRAEIEAYLLGGRL
jgi:excisionase family DNA binding protein